jgi:phosphotriesterase-related protein
MATIQSATGPIDTANLGFTLMHEHVRVGYGPMYQQYPSMYDREKDLALAVGRFKEAIAAGVKTIVDLTPIDLGRDVTLIRDAARQSGMQIIAPTGFYYSIPFVFMFGNEDEMTRLLVRDITVGVDNTGVRANVIKCATEPEMHHHNERVLRCSARAAKETGVPICTHTFPENRTGLDQQRVFKEEGLDLSRTVIGHSDDSDDITYLEQIIQNGSYCGMDRFGLPAPRTTEQRAEMVAKLVEKGYADRITLSHDSCSVFHMGDQAQIGAFAPEWKITHISLNVIPMLKKMGVSDAAITQMTVNNPRKLFGG